MRSRVLKGEDGEDEGGGRDGGDEDEGGGRDGEGEGEGGDRDGENEVGDS
jgi:hypothetical protein